MLIQSWLPEVAAHCFYICLNVFFILNSVEFGYIKFEEKLQLFYMFITVKMHIFQK